MGRGICIFSVFGVIVFGNSSQRLVFSRWIFKMRDLTGCSVDWIRPALRAGLSSGSPWVEKTRHLTRLIIFEIVNVLYSWSHISCIAEFTAGWEDVHGWPHDWVQSCPQPFAQCAVIILAMVRFGLPPAKTRPTDVCALLLERPA